LTLRSAGLKKGKKAPGEKLSALTPVPEDAEFGKTSPTCQTNSPQARIVDSSSIKRSQLFIGLHNETLSVVAMRPNSTGLAQICGRSIVSFDRPFDNLGFLGDKLRQMLLYVVRSQAHRLISTGFVLKDADGRALALTSIKPIVAYKPLRLLNDWHEVLAYSAVDLCTVLRIKVVVANDGKHNTSP